MAPFGAREAYRVSQGRSGFGGMLAESGSLNRVGSAGKHRARAHGGSKVVESISASFHKHQAI